MDEICPRKKQRCTSQNGFAPNGRALWYPVSPLAPAKPKPTHSRSPEAPEEAAPDGRRPAARRRKGRSQQAARGFPPRTEPGRAVTSAPTSGRCQRPPQPGAAGGTGRPAAGWKPARKTGGGRWPRGAVPGAELSRRGRGTAPYLQRLPGTASGAGPAGSGESAEGKRGELGRVLCRSRAATPSPAAAPAPAAARAARASASSRRPPASPQLAPPASSSRRRQSCQCVAVPAGGKGSSSGFLPRQLRGQQRGARGKVRGVKPGCATLTHPPAPLRSPSRLCRPERGRDTPGVGRAVEDPAYSSEVTLCSVARKLQLPPHTHFKCSEKSICACRSRVGVQRQVVVLLTRGGSGAGRRLQAASQVLRGWSLLSHRCGNQQQQEQLWCQYLRAVNR